MSQPKPVVEMIGDIVQAMRTAEVSPDVSLTQHIQNANPSIVQIHYMYGHPLELIENLKERSKDPGRVDKDLPKSNWGGKWDMWPVVMLFTDFPEVYTKKPISYKQEVTLQVVMAMFTEKLWKAEERMDKNFKPILYPMYEQFLTQLDKSAHFVVQSSKQIPHTKWDRLYWGKSGLYGNVGNTFNDAIDAIEIQNLVLKINY